MRNRIALAFLISLVSVSGRADNPIVRAWGYLPSGQVACGAGGQTVTTCSVQGFGLPFRTIGGTTASDTADPSGVFDVVILWNSSSGAGKSQAIPGCTSFISGRNIWIADEFGDAGANNITITPGSGTINGAATNVIATNRAAVQLHCDGSGTNTNWVII